MIENLAAMQLHGVNGLSETIATIAAFLILHLIANR